MQVFVFLMFVFLALNRTLILEISADEVEEEDRAGIKTWDPTFFTPHEGTTASMLLLIS